MKEINVTSISFSSNIARPIVYIPFSFNIMKTDSDNRCDLDRIHASHSEINLVRQEDG